MIQQNAKIKALSQFLGCSDSDISCEGLSDIFYHGNHGEYLVLDRYEARLKTFFAILDSIEYFNPEFIAKHSTLPYVAVKALQASIDRRDFEFLDLNQIFLDTIRSKKRFVDDAIHTDGRGHFLATYDGKEHKFGKFYIYRTY